MRERERNPNKGKKVQNYFKVIKKIKKAHEQSFN